MIGPDTLLAFVATTCGFMLVPGPAMLYVISVGVERGKKSAQATAVGLAAGCLLLATAAAVGLTAVLAASESLFVGLKVCGAAYLVWLGVRRLLLPVAAFDADELAESPAPTAPPGAKHGSLAGEVGRGIMVSLSNPKDALFFLALLPQFAHDTQGNAQWQMFTLGCVFALIALIFDSGYALVAARARRIFARHPRVWRSQRWLSGCLYLALAVAAILSPHRVRPT